MQSRHIVPMDLSADAVDALGTILQCRFFLPPGSSFREIRSSRSGVARAPPRGPTVENIGPIRRRSGVHFARIIDEMGRPPVPASAFEMRVR